MLFRGHITAYPAITFLLSELSRFCVRMSRKVLLHKILVCLCYSGPNPITVASTLPGLNFKHQNGAVCPWIYFSINLHTFQPLFPLAPSDLLTPLSVFISLPPSSKHRKHVLENPACVSLHFKVRVSSRKINTGLRKVAVEQSKTKLAWLHSRVLADVHADMEAYAQAGRTLAFKKKERKEAASDAITCYRCAIRQPGLLSLL